MRDLVAPNGVRIGLSHIDPPMHEPATQQALVVSRRTGDAEWSVGRTGLRYRVPERSAGVEVIEIGSPAEHITLADHGLIAFPRAAVLRCRVQSAGKGDTQPCGKTTTSCSR